MEMSSLKRSSPFTAILVTILITLFSGKVYGCDCIMSPVERDVKSSDNIIIAKAVKVVSLKEFLYDDRQEIVFEVTRVLKGGLLVKSQFEFTRGDNCDPTFMENETYLLFCHKEEKEKYHIYHCGYSDKKSKSRKVIKKIERELKRLG